MLAPSNYSKLSQGLSDMGLKTARTEHFFTILQSDQPVSLKAFSGAPHYPNFCLQGLKVAKQGKKWTSCNLLPLRAATSGF